MQESTRVLLVSNDEKETKFLWDVLSPHAILTCSQKLPEFKMLLQGGIYDIVLCEWSFGQGTWKEVLKAVQEFHPELPVVILAKTAEERERLDVMKAGAIDLLVQPFLQHALLAVLERAVDYRRARNTSRGLPYRGLQMKSSGDGKN
jgi:DNA-binding NtrC family response regulator